MLWREEGSATRYEVLNNSSEVGNDPRLETVVMVDSEELKTPEDDADTRTLLYAPLLSLEYAIIEPEEESW